MRLSGVIFAIIVLWTATLGMMVVGLHGFLFSVFLPEASQSVARFIQVQWLTTISSLVERMLGVEMVFSGDHFDVIQKDRRVLFLSNHRTRLDWMFLWSLFARYQMLFYLRIVLKAGMRKAPIFGWIMESLGYIFLSRSSKNWNTDREYFTKSVRAACKKDRNTCVLIFPEGTDLSESNLLKTNEWGKKNGFAHVKSYTLHPRVKGFRVMLDAAIKDIDSVVDITLGYVDRNNTRCSEKSILRGELPSRIVCHCTRFSRKDVQQIKDIESWLHSRFDSKEVHLKDFYENKRTRLHTHTLLSHMPDIPGVLASYLFWFFLSVLTCYILFFRPFILLSTLASCVSYFIAMRILYGGVDRYLLKNQF